ncbi:MAG: hypothetical protein LLF83_08615 [Methanobacterium sp.]|nr:hypothetical protein [Methanobacterium sp.]
MSESKMLFRRESGSKKKDNILLEVDEDRISLQNRRENALIITFKAVEDEIKDIYQFFNDFDELEPIFVNIADAGDVGYYYRGISSVEQENEGKQKFSVTLQLRRDKM